MKEKIIAIALGLVSIVLIFTAYKLDSVRQENSQLRIQAYKNEMRIIGLEKEVLWRRYNDSLLRVHRITAPVNRWLDEKERKFQTKSNKQIKESPLRAVR